MTAPVHPRTLSREHFEQVLEVAQELGWVSPVYCQTHDGAPLTEEEDEEMIDGGDPCVFALRVYEGAGEGPWR